MKRNGQGNPPVVKAVASGLMVLSVAATPVELLAAPLTLTIEDTRADDPDAILAIALDPDSLTASEALPVGPSEIVELESITVDSLTTETVGPGGDSLLPVSDGIPVGPVLGSVGSVGVTTGGSGLGSDEGGMIGVSADGSSGATEEGTGCIETSCAMTEVERSSTHSSNARTIVYE